jgi:hypothetical protein
MPYIRPEDRPQYTQVLEQIPVIQSKGELEFCIFWLMQRFMYTREARYSTLHEAVYAAQHCADEYRRRFLDLREDDARVTNGDVIP